jgi:hypothetical protein
MPVTMKIKIEKHADGKFKSLRGSADDYEFWIDQNGVFRCINKNEVFDRILSQLLAGPSLPSE